MIDLAIHELRDSDAILRWRWSHYSGRLPSPLSLWGRWADFPRQLNKPWEELIPSLEYSGTIGKEIRIELPAGNWDLVIAPSKGVSVSKKRMAACVSNELRLWVGYDGVHREL